MAATRAMTGPVLMTISGMGDFLGELVFIPVDDGNSDLVKGSEKGIPVGGNESCGLAGRNAAEFEQLRGKGKAHGMLEFLPGQPRAVRQAFRVFDQERVHDRRLHPDGKHFKRQALAARRREWGETPSTMKRRPLPKAIAKFFRVTFRRRP